MWLFSSCSQLPSVEDVSPFRFQLAIFSFSFDSLLAFFLPILKSFWLFLKSSILDFWTFPIHSFFHELERNILWQYIVLFDYIFLPNFYYFTIINYIWLKANTPQVLPYITVFISVPFLSKWVCRLRKKTTPLLFQLTAIITFTHIYIIRPKQTSTI